jgi:elongation factor 1 alpha-like protein
VLDETNEERERGITMDVGHSAFQTKTKNVTLLDAPGHRDFIPNMISGAYQADVAILVVNATRGEFEAGFDQGGQTREHALLVRSLGVSQLIVAVNKLDTVQWSKERFDDIVLKLGKFLKTQVGFKDSDLTFVPVSGLTGANLKEEDNKQSGDRDNEDSRQLLFQWYDGPSLIQAIDDLRSPERLIDKPFRMSISDIFKPTTSGAGGFCAAGRIETGYIQKNDTVLISPLNEYATVKNILLDNALPSSSSLGLNCAFAGDHVSLTLSGTGSGPSTLDPANLTLGMIVCDPSQPVKVSKHFSAKLVVLGVETPITKGFACVLHHGGVTEAASLKKLVAQLSKGTGEIVKRKPRILAKNSSAQVEITTASPVCIETYAESKELGRFMLRAGGITIAAGMVTDIH